MTLLTIKGSYILKQTVFLVRRIQISTFIMETLVLVIMPTMQHMEEIMFGIVTQVFTTYKRVVETSLTLPGVEITEL